MKNLKSETDQLAEVTAVKVVFEALVSDLGDGWTLENCRWIVTGKVVAIVRHASETDGYVFHCRTSDGQFGLYGTADRGGPAPYRRFAQLSSAVAALRTVIESRGAIR
jgi:hypothetical protein